MTAAPTAKRRRWPGAKTSPTSSPASISRARNSPVAPILIDLAQRDTINRSSRFAETALGQLHGVTDILARSPHRAASLAVLVAPDVPAVLIELGYLSNDRTRPDEHRSLAGARWRRPSPMRWTAISPPGRGNSAVNAP